MLSEELPHRKPVQSLSLDVNPSERRAERGDHHFYRWQGAAHEVGRQHGQALKTEIRAEFAPALAQMADALGRSEAQTLDRYLALYEPIFQDVLPRAIEEIRGLAAGAELDYKRAFFAATRDGAKLPRDISLEEGCTAFYCGPNTTRDGRVLLGQTKDTAAPLARYRIAERRYDDGSASLTLNYPGWLAHVGISSCGLAHIGNSLYAASPAVETIPFSLLKRLVLECESTQAVLDASAGLIFENCCVMIADAGGHAVCLEYVAGRRSARDISQQAFGHANSILDPELQGFEEYSARPNSDQASSEARQKGIQRRLDEKSGDLDMRSLKSAVADHTGFPRSICRHAPDGASQAGASRTTAAFIGDLSAREAHICIGNPCAAPFQEYSIGEH